MGAHLPFRNTYQKGIYPFLGQTRYCAPDENSGLIRWADPLTMVTYSLIPLERSPRHLHVLFLSLFTCVLLPHLFPLPPFPHQPPICYINLNGNPIPVMNNENYTPLYSMSFARTLICGGQGGERLDFRLSFKKILIWWHHLCIIFCGMFVTKQRDCVIVQKECGMDQYITNTIT